MWEKKLEKDMQKKLHNDTQPLSTQLSHLPIICNNNKLGMTSLVQMRQSGKYWSVRNDEIITFTF